MQKPVNELSESDLRVYWNWAACCKWTAAILAIEICVLLAVIGLILDMPFDPTSKLEAGYHQAAPTAQSATSPPRCRGYPAYRGQEL